MINIKKILTLILIVVIFTGRISLAEDMVGRSSLALVNLGIMIGDHTGNLNLNNKITRCEFVTLVNRMMAYDLDNVSEDSLSFTDMDKSHWGYRNVLVAVNKGLIRGYTDNTFRPDNYVTFAEAQTILLRALGYEQTIKDPWPAGVLRVSSDIKLNNYLTLETNKNILRSEASILIYNALGINIYGR